MHNNVERIPLCYSLAYHSLSCSKDENNPCLKDFLLYMGKATRIANKKVANEINTRILQKLSSPEEKHDLLQACNLEMNIDDVEEYFPSLLRSKQITRQQIEAILDQMSSAKNT